MRDVQITFIVGSRKDEVYIAIDIKDSSDVIALINAGLLRLLRYPHKYAWSAGGLVPFLKVGLSVLGMSSGNKYLLDSVKEVLQSCSTSPDAPIRSYYHNWQDKDYEPKPPIVLDPEKIPWKFDKGAV